MGFDIYAYESDKETTEIAYLRAYMGAFRMCREQGYDWFELIDAYECYGGVSGNGNGKYIALTKLLNAMYELQHHDTKGKLADSSFDGTDMRNEWAYRKPILRKFMRTCIEWCTKNKKKEVYIYFG